MAIDTRERERREDGQLHREDGRLGDEVGALSLQIRGDLDVSVEAVVAGVTGSWCDLRGRRICRRLGRRGRTGAVGRGP